MARAGGQHPKACSQSWVLVSEVPRLESWSVQPDSLSPTAGAHLPTASELKPDPHSLPAENSVVLQHCAPPVSRGHAGVRIQEEQGGRGQRFPSITTQETVVAAGKSPSGHI